MSYNEESAEVAEDYRHALEDLTMNSRYEITNLTVVARENTEHAHAIAEVLQDHIRKVAPQRKLPALYVLDSIVKNVGTPYTLFFGRRLYQTFMDAYASVDSMTRRKMDEMLKTWKESVPGSIDTRPVFPPDIVRPIENALIKARTTALQAQQESMRGQQQLLTRGRPAASTGSVPYRDTPTPPDGRPSSRQAGPYGYPHQLPYQGANGTHHNHQAYPVSANTTPQPHFPSRSTPQPGPSIAPAPAYPQPPAQDVYGAPQSGISIDHLNDDIAQLIVATKAELAQSNHDASIQNRLGALLELQRLLQRQQLPQDQLVLVKNQVSELAVNIRGPKPQQLSLLPATTHTHTPTPTPPQAVPSSRLPPSSTPIPPVAVAPPPPSASAAPGAVSLDSLLGQGALATLLAGANKPATPQTPQALFPVARPPSTAQPSAPEPARRTPARAPPPTDPAALMAALRQSGLLPPGPGPAAPATPATHGPLSIQLTQGLASLLSPSKAGAVAPPPAENGIGGIQLNASSLKLFRPYLLPSLYEELGPPCTQCGRRFRTDEEGRRKKMAHMDWHFRVHQRIAEAEKRGQHRSWYIDEMEWIKSREAIDTDYVAPQTENKTGGADTAAGAAKPQYIPVPDDAQTNNVCPICQEKFEMKWLDEAQEWVWMDAVQVGPRVFHATCHSEAARDRENTPAAAAHSRNTPEPVLGKRKAEGDHPSVRGKVKIEGY